MSEHYIERSGRRILVLPRGVPFKRAQLAYVRAHALYWQAQTISDEASHLVSDLKEEIAQAANDQPTLIATLKREEYRRAHAVALLDAATRMLDVAREDYLSAGALENQNGDPIEDAEGPQPGWDVE